MNKHSHCGRESISTGLAVISVITRCAYAQGRVKRLSPSIYLFVCVSSKNTYTYLATEIDALALRARDVYTSVPVVE